MFSHSSWVGIFDDDDDDDADAAAADDDDDDDDDEEKHKSLARLKVWVMRIILCAEQQVKYSSLSRSPLFFVIFCSPARRVRVA